MCTSCLGYSLSLEQWISENVGGVYKICGTMHKTKIEEYIDIFN